MIKENEKNIEKVQSMSSDAQIGYEDIENIQIDSATTSSESFKIGGEFGIGTEFYEY